jgi:NAD-dependent dihydropyrimidine dehydrogenase PreA subunit
MNAVYLFLARALEPFGSPFFLLGILLVLQFAFKRTHSPIRRWVSLLAFAGVFWLVYRVLLLNPDAARWLRRTSGPIPAVLGLMVIPAIFLPNNKWYKLFLVVPAAVVLLAIAEVAHQYRHAPNPGFIWFPIRPGFLIAAVTAIAVIAKYFLSTDKLRAFVRVTVLLVLLYGGFALRQDYLDYKEMLARRQDATKDIMSLSDTTPVMKSDNRLTYLPSAPCRFSADGGYVQGCVMELFQRTLQVHYGRVAGGDPVEVALLAIALAALLVLVILGYIGARWWCGWICPLSTLGDAFNTARRWIGLPYMKPTQPVKLAYLYSGLSLGTFGLLLSKAYARIDEQGRFLGCKIPLYPFCKICPGQQVCPVASQGIGAYPPLPGTEWLFGFFKVAALFLLVLFLIGFITARRLWCRLCPMGMVGGIFNRGGLLALKKDVRKCNGCGVCNEVCPMDIQSVQEEMSSEDVSSFDCVYCMKCVTHCPQDRCLRVEFAGQCVTESDFFQKMKHG